MEPSYRKKDFFQYIRTLFTSWALLARWHKPSGALLLYLPCCWGLAQAGGGVRLYLLFALGALALRGAGCTYNDMLDARYDRHVGRTQTRPLACGASTRPQALLWMVCQLAVGLAVLCALPPPVWPYAVAALPLVALYPFLKRWTYFAQVFLGLTFNWGVLMASVAVLGHVPLDGWLLYATGILWTLVYDTVYAYQDIEDDRRLGLKSMPLLLRDRPKPTLRACILAMEILPCFVLGVNLSFVWWMILASYRLALKKLDLQDSPSCQRFFGSRSISVGVVLWILLMVEKIWS